MDKTERLRQLEQAHAQHVQLLQQTQANIIRIEGAMEILREVVAEENAAKPAEPTDPPATVTKISSKQQRLREVAKEVIAPSETS